MSTRLDRALQRWWLKTEERRWIFGLVGRVNSDGTVTVEVAERPDFVYVRMNSNGETQTLTIARNQGKVPLRAGLPVKMRREAGVLVIEDVDRSGLLEDDANAPGTVYSVNGLSGDVVLDSDDITEGAANLYMTDAERTKLTGIAEGAEVNVNADWSAVSGDAQILNKPTIPTVDAASVGAAIHGATAKTTPVDADTVPLIDSAASNTLKKLSWANLKATLKTYFDTLYTAINTAVLLTGDQTVAGVKTWSNNAIFNGLVGIGTTPADSAIKFTLFNTAFVLQAWRVGNTNANHRDWAMNVGGNTVGGFDFMVGDSAGDTPYGTGKQVLTMTKERNVGLRTTSPQGIFHAHDGTGGDIFVTKTGIGSTAQTIIPDGTGDVTAGLYYRAVIKPSTGTVFGISNAINNGSDVTIYDSGGNRLNLRVNANGSVDVRTTLGSATFSIAISFVWL